MKLKEILGEIDKRKTKWEKIAFIQLVLEQTDDPEISRQLSKIMESLQKRETSMEPIRVPEAPELKEPELEEIVESPPEEQLAPLKNEFGMNTLAEPGYTPLKTENEVSEEYQKGLLEESGPELEQGPIKGSFIDFVDWDLGGKRFNIKDDELIVEDLDKKIKEEAYKRREGHG